MHSVADTSWFLMTHSGGVGMEGKGEREGGINSRYQ